MTWDVDPVVHNDQFGIFTVVVSSPKKPSLDVSFYRNIPSRIDSLTFADPFGDSTASIFFPQVTPYDDILSPALWWIRPWTNYDIFWVPATTTKTSARDVKCINPLTNVKDLWLNFEEKETVWEGFSISIDPTDDGTTIQLQGALFQLDRYLALPFFPSRPVAGEVLIKRAFSPTRRPLRTQPLAVEYPCTTCAGGIVDPQTHNPETHVGWTKQFKFPKATTDPQDKEGMYYAFVPTGLPEGAPWSGYSSRNSGANDARLLTGYVQNLLGSMYTPPDAGLGIPAGDQWTIRKDPGRKPVLHIRQTSKEADFELWYGLPGVTMQLTYDGLNISNVIYGEGNGEDYVKWSNTQISANGQTTTRSPLVADVHVYPYEDNLSATPDVFPSEVNYNFGEGITQALGVSAAQFMLRRDGSPGWVGSITIQVDPDENTSKWSIRPGMVVKIKGYMGFIDGVNMHISEVVLNPQEGTVQMKVDSKFRDLLSVEQVQASVRDTQTPVKMLQVNKRAYLIEDMVRPWDYSLGSGYIPTTSVPMHNARSNSDVFPWEKMLQRYPPSAYPLYYTKCNANDAASKNRWAKQQIITAQAFKIRRTEVVVCDKDGNILPIKFHMSVYPVFEPTYPVTGSNYSPFAEHHFESVSENGLPWGPTDFYKPDPSMIVGWGNKDQGAGFYPKRESDTYPDPLTGDPLPVSPSGMLVDESSWTYNFVSQASLNFMKNYDPGRHFELLSRTELWVNFYAEYTEPVYFTGRLFREEPGQ